VIEIHQPGAADADAFDRAMVVDLDAYDAELVERDGPEALALDRLLRQTALAAEQNPALIGSALAAYRESRGWSREQLAEWLGLSADGLAGLALEVRDAAPAALGERYGTDEGRLSMVLGADNGNHP